MNFPRASTRLWIRARHILPLRGSVLKFATHSCWLIASLFRNVGAKMASHFDGDEIFWRNTHNDRYFFMGHQRINSGVGFLVGLCPTGG
jgi:hypothetical protein